MVADYAYIRDHQDKALATALVVRAKPSNMMIVTVCDEKELDSQVVSRLARLIKDTGYEQFAYRSDQEPGLRAV